MVLWHYVVAGVLAVITRAAFSEVGHMRRAGWNVVVISAHDHTDAVHHAVASLNIPGLTIVDTNKLPQPDFITQLLLSAVSAAIFLLLFLFFLWLLRRIWPERPQN